MRMDAPTLLLRKSHIFMRWGIRWSRLAAALPHEATLFIWRARRTDVQPRRGLARFMYGRVETGPEKMCWQRPETA